MSDTHKYYWLKLRRDFFKRHDIRIVEEMENGKDYLLFYMKLLVESIDHDGDLRFSDTIPYNDKMLATVTNTNIDIVRSAVKVFAELGMMERMDDGTLFMTQVSTMIGSETNDAARMRIARAKKPISLPDNGEANNVQECSEVFEKRSPEIEIELDKDKEIDKEPEKEKPVKHKYGTFQNVLLSDAEKQRLYDDYQDIADMSINYLSEYKVEKSYKSNNDNLTIRRWVIDAVRKREGLPPIKKGDIPKPTAIKQKPCTCGGYIINGVCKTCGKLYDAMGEPI